MPAAKQPLGVPFHRVGGQGHDWQRGCWWALSFARMASRDGDPVHVGHLRVHQDQVEGLPFPVPRQSRVPSPARSAMCPHFCSRLVASSWLELVILGDKDAETARDAALGRPRARDLIGRGIRPGAKARSTALSSSRTV